MSGLEESAFPISDVALAPSLSLSVVSLASAASAPHHGMIMAPRGHHPQSERERASAPASTESTDISSLSCMALGRNRAWPEAGLPSCSIRVCQGFLWGMEKILNDPVQNVLDP